MTAIENPDQLARDQVLPLLEALPQLGNTTTVILHGGCVFEFKGPFPGGTVAEGFYNLHGAPRHPEDPAGFEGHLRLEAMARVRFQDRPHRGRASYAFVFEDENGRCLFKVFLGRDADGEIIPEQFAFFDNLRRTRNLSITEEPNA